MDRLPGATSLARALLALERARATGVLEVRAARRSARLALVSGTPTAAVLDPDDGETLGDVLARDGALDREAHARALAEGAPSTPVGEWLVETGAATRPAVEYALRRQLRRRVGLLFGWSAAELSFRRGAADVGVPHVSEPVRTPDLVLGAMRDVVSETPVLVARRRLGDSVAVLSRLGAALLAEATLWPEEAAMVPLLERGAPVEVVLGAAGGSRRGILGLYALKLLSAVGSPGAGRGAYGVLLRKRRQLRHALGNDDLRLLDLPAGARPEDARRALRRLAHLVHPDRFGDHEAPAVRRASSEIMAALVQAEQRLAGR